MARSPFFYVGDKYKLTGQFKNIFPEKIKRLIEPFCGGGSVFLNTDANEYLANDNNEWMIKLHKFIASYADKEDNFFKKLEELIISYGFSASSLGINVSNELKKKHPKTHYAIYNKQQYKQLKEDFNENQEDMFRLYLLLVFGFNHMLRFNKNGKFNLPVGDVDYNNNVKKALHGYFEFIKHKKITFFCEDFEKFIEAVDLTSEDFIYLDPPYLISKSEYNKFWTEDEEIRLLKLIDKLSKKGIRFALSNVLSHKGNNNQILIEWSKKYKVYDIKANYISYHDNTIKHSKEVLIVNY